MEEIRGVTWDFGSGQRLYPFQAAQYLHQADPPNGPPPFRDAKRLMEACAVMGGESGWYLTAWHLNVKRDSAGNILWDEQRRLLATSCDLGWIQRNAEFADTALLPEDVPAFVQALFDSPEFGYLDRPALAAQEAARLFTERGWQPWVAWLNKSYKRHLPMAGQAVANFLAVEYGLGQSFYVIRTR